MAKRPYGKVCRRPVEKIKKVIKEKMRDFAKEWAEKGGGSASEWWAFLSEKLKADIRSLPITCG